MSDGTVVADDPYGWFGIVAAVLMIAAAAAAALIIAGSLLRGRARGTDLAFEIGAAVLLLAVSAGAAAFSSYIVRGEQPLNTNYAAFSGEDRQLVFAEERYRSENLLKIFLANSAENGTPCEMKICVPLNELTADGGFQERYGIYTVAENVARIGFEDGYNYRTIEITF